MTTGTTGETQTLATNSEPLVQRTTLASGTVLADRYRICELIGEGGMGDVYLATHLTIGKEVAIKVLAPEQMRRPRTVGRFLQEAKAASKIRHENVVDINDYGESDGCAFFVMEYLVGEDLSVLVKREGRLTWPRIKSISIQLLAALAAAHGAGVVHRDIKPHNCFITPRVGNPDFVKVIDFGIAKLREGSEEQLTRTGTILGTAEYMSPEQGMGTELDGRSDLYSVGIILYRMLTGAVPYRGNNPMSILYQHIHAPRVPPSEACPEAEIGPRIDALVLKALARKREDRFASAEEFAAAIQAIDTIGDGRGDGAHGKLARVGRWAIVAIVATAAAVVGLATASWAWQPEPEIAATEIVATEIAATEIAATEIAATEEVDAVKLEETPAEALTPPDAPLDENEVVLDEDLGLEQDAENVSVTEVPVHRSAREISTRLSRIDGKVRACGKAAGLFPGESVGVRLQIAPNGRVQSAKIKGAFSRAGAACIEQAVVRTRFSAARKPQSVEHRFTL